MRTLQTDPYSPATQPYNQAKPFIATPGFGQPMQQQPPQQQQANGIKIEGPNPFDFGLFNTNVQHQMPQQTQGEPAKETQSPIPAFVSFQTGVQPTGNDAFSSLAVATSQPSTGQGGAMTLQNFSGAASAETAPRGPPVVPEYQFTQGTAGSQGAPVTPSPQYGKPGAAIQSSNAGQNQMFHPSTPPQQYNAPFASNFGVSMPSGLPPPVPSTPPPTGVQIQNTAIGSSGVVSPHRDSNGGSPSGQTDFDDFFSGPPMGTPTDGANKLGVSSYAMVSNSYSPGNQYEGIVDGMGNLSVGQPIQLALPSQGNRPYQNYSTSYPPHMGNQEAQAPFQQQSHVVQLVGSNVPGGQQPQMNQSPTNWSYGTHPSPSSPWDAQQRQPYSPEQAQGQIQQIPRLNHSPRGPATGDARGCSALNEAEPYGPHSRYYDPMDVKPYNSIDDHKNSTDVIRERGAGMRALRLLDETTTGGYTSEVVPLSEYKVKSLRQAVKEERVRVQTAKEIRKMKKLEYKSKEKMAESSRQTNTFRGHYDPELTEDKCQMDFDRQRHAQKKALKLMRKF